MNVSTFYPAAAASFLVGIILELRFIHKHVVNDRKENKNMRRVISVKYGRASRARRKQDDR